MTRSCPVAGLYSGAVHYVKTLKTMGGNSHDGAKVATTKELPTDDVLLGKGTSRRPQDASGLFVRGEKTRGVESECPLVSK